MLRSWLSFVELTISRILRTCSVVSLFELLPIWHLCKGIFFFHTKKKHFCQITGDSCFGGAHKQHKLSFFYPQDCVSVSRIQHHKLLYWTHSTFIEKSEANEVESAP